jgi:hypothetical protein
VNRSAVAATVATTVLLAGCGDSGYGSVPDPDDAARQACRLPPQAPVTSESGRPDGRLDYTLAEQWHVTLAWDEASGRWVWTDACWT